MCGRFAVDSEINELIEEFVATGGDVGDWRPSYNIRPTDPVPVVLESAKTGTVVRRLETARWSLVPSFSKELKLKYPTFNARSEDVASKASFKASVVNKRALIPASGYYEWRTVGKAKTPFYIHDPNGTMAFAALYLWWRDRSLADDDPARWVLTATILTMPAVPHLAEIHDRNPVPLPREFWDGWLSTDIDGDQGLVDAAVAAGSSVAAGLAFHQVAPLGADGPELIAPVTP
jgi:putative SOS response-associated peptidase YedK